eukprot:4794466-Heterocapsa_arctica.AAC.1
MKHMQKIGGGPTGWLNRLTADKKWGSTDRTVYELQAWARVIETAGSYDQLNLPTTACFEIATRRVALLIDAHMRDPLNP